MILTCGTCGHRGEDGKDYNHDCYWVFRERGKQARLKATSAEPQPDAIAVDPAAESQTSGLRADRLRDLQIELASERTARHALEQENERLKSDCDDLDSANSDLHDEFGELETRVEEAEDRAEAAEAKLSQLQEAIRELIEREYDSLNGQGKARIWVLYLQPFARNVEAALKESAMSRNDIIRQCEYLATATRKVTCAYRLEDRSVTYQVADYPIKGTLIATCRPEGGDAR